MPLQPAIQVPEGAQSITIGADGTVSAQLAGQTEPTEPGQIELARFINPPGLSPHAGNILIETAASGAPQVGPAAPHGRGSSRRGLLEGSTVTVVKEQVAILEPQRAYERTSNNII